jgi:hypothetical protein
VAAVDHETDYGNPIRLSSRSRAKGQTLLADLEQYWRALRRARKIPVRTDVNPAQIDAILPYSFILERVAPGVGRLRVAGQSLNAILGVDSRGMPLSAFFSAASRPVLARCLDQVFDGPALVEIPLMTPRTLTMSRLTGSLLILPLLGTDGSISRALGALVVDGVVRKAGQQFDIPEPAPIRHEFLSDPQPIGRTIIGGGKIAVAQRRKHHLRLIISND